MNTLINAETIETMLGHARLIAEHNGVELDFSPKSIKDIDRILNVMHKEYSTEEEHNEEGISGICLSLGMYIGEYIRRDVKQERLLWWYGTPAAGGEATAFLKMDESEVYTIDWVAKQIMNGSQDSVDEKVDFHIHKLLERSS